MNLVEKLLKTDAKKTEELATGVYKSKRLAKILGLEGTVNVELREIKSRRMNDISTYHTDKNGKIDYGKLFDSKLIVCVEGITNPDPKNEELKAHFGCSNARELCEKLFGPEIHEISDKIIELSGLTEEKDAEEEIKN